MDVNRQREGAATPHLLRATIVAEHLQQSRHHLVLRLRMSQAAVSTEAPAEAAVLVIDSHRMVEATGNIDNLDTLDGHHMIVASLLDEERNPARSILALVGQFVARSKVLSLGVVTKLAVLWEAERKDRSSTVDDHAELGATSQLGDRLAFESNLQDKCFSFSKFKTLTSTYLGWCENHLRLLPNTKLSRLVVTTGKDNTLRRKEERMATPHSTTNYFIVLQRLHLGRFIASIGVTMSQLTTIVPAPSQYAIILSDDQRMASSATAYRQLDTILGTMRSPQVTSYNKNIKTKT